VSIDFCRCFNSLWSSMLNSAIDDYLALFQASLNPGPYLEYTENQKLLLNASED
jgi:hypothetical protein